MKHLFSLLIMLVIGIFLMQPAYAQLAPANQPVFMAGDWVLVDASVAMPTKLNKTSLSVAPAVLPGHLKPYKDNLLNVGITGISMVVPLKKGGFQKVEIVLLIKSALPTNPQYIHIPNENGILLSHPKSKFAKTDIILNTLSGAGPTWITVSGTLEVGTIIKGPSLVFTPSDTYVKSLYSTGSLAG